MLVGRGGKIIKERKRKEKKRKENNK